MLKFESWPLSAKYFTRTLGKYGLYAHSKQKPKRYRHLLQETKQQQPKVIVEIGVYNGLRAMELLETAALHNKMTEIEYYGFDLFRSLSEQEMKAEYSKQPNSKQEVQQYLEKSGANIQLHEGFTTDTLPAFTSQWSATNKTADIVFIDGGHALETIEFDWQQIEKIMDANTVVIFDDYYTCDNTNAIAEIGCQKIIDSLSASMYKSCLYPTVDSFEREFGTQHIQFARVQKA